MENSENREAQVIHATASPITIGTLCSDLNSLGLDTGDIILVHTSLSKLGWVCGGAQAVIAALLKTTGADMEPESAGTVIMPAHSGNLSDPAEWAHPPVPKEWLQVIYDTMPPYIPEITPTAGIGRVPELFRIYPGVLRSGHPQVSFCAKGKEAAAITEVHPLTPQLGMESPLGALYKRNASVLLLGAGYGSCTSFHLAETLFDKMPVKRLGTPLLENGTRVWKWFEDYDYDNSDFDRIGEEFERECPVKRGKVGNADCRLFSLKSGVDFALQWLEKNRI